ncbi:haloacid dehalogenase type II [Yoonia sp.]|uniref:haloacid dehalogenase type II n=1 Tax=Yoonia sp. TaxID=2212373 RepID=UPI0023B3FE9A
MPITTFVFDAYGTLFDVNSAAARAAQEPAHQDLKEVWPALARDWRLKQLQYTWLRTVADRHCDFWQVTKDGLDWAMEAHGLSDENTRARLLALYRELSAYPEVVGMLKALKDRGVATAILSNGSPQLLDEAVTSAGLDGLLNAVLSVEAVGVFKPHARVYDLVCQLFGGTPDNVLFVSSNGWDAAGAAGYGFQTVWVNRAGEPVDRLYAKPHHILSDLATIPEFT